MFDPDLIARKLNEFWADYGDAVIIGTGMAVLLLVGLAAVLIVQSKRRDWWVDRLAWALALAWTSEALWQFARDELDLSVAFATGTFFVFEAMMLSTVLKAEAYRKLHGTPGPAGRYMWLLALTSGGVAALAASSLATVVFRLAVPLTATGMYWLGLISERPDDTPQVKAARVARDAARAAKRAARRESRRATWAVTPQDILVRLGIRRPGDRDVTTADREYRVNRMVSHADRILSRPGRGGGWSRWRLRRLARGSTGEEVAEVRARLDRVTAVLSLVTPTAPAGALRGGNPGEGVARPVQSPGSPTAGDPGSVPPESPGSVPGDFLPGDPGNPAPGGSPAARGGSTSPSRVTRGTRHPRKDEAEQVWRDSVAAGSPVSGGELRRLFGVDESTGRAWIRGWQKKVDAVVSTSNGDHWVKGE